MMRTLVYVLLAILIGFILAGLQGCTSMSVDQLRWTFHTANAVDVGTTLHGLDQGCTEGSPLAGGTDNKATIVGLGLLASGAAEFVCGHVAAEQGQEKACWIAFTWVKLLAGSANAYTINRGCQ